MSLNLAVEKPSWVQIAPQFQRSINLQKDWKESRFKYVDVATNSELATEIAIAAHQKGGVRAWTITGPFGSGKSAFAYFLADLLARKRPTQKTSRDLKRTFLPGTQPFEPLFVQAKREALTKSVADSLSTQYPNWQVPATDDLTDQISEIASKANHGLLLIVDEMGKYLEFAARNPSEDLFPLQELAEFVSRASQPVVFVGILHSGFSDYLRSSQAAERLEWQKVQGRFHDVPFNIQKSEALELIGNAIDTSFPEQIETYFRNTLTDICTTLGASHDSFRELTKTYNAALPLHPLVTQILWAIFRTQIAQNYRSLFSFLSSNERYGFREFCTDLDESGRVDLYSLAHLYDYIQGNLGSAVLVGAHARHWQLIEHAISRIPGRAKQYLADIVKTVGLLNLYGDEIKVKASRKVIEASLLPQIYGDFDSAIQELEDLSILILRRYDGSYRLWEGSDFDIEDATDQALAQNKELSLQELLDERQQVSAIPAARYFIEKGTARYASVRIHDLEKVESIDLAQFKNLACDAHLLLLVSEEIESSKCRRRAKALSKRLSLDVPVLVGLLREPAQITQQLRYISALCSVLSDSSELASDSIATQEVKSRLLYANESFLDVAGPAFGLDGHLLEPSRIEWFLEGKNWGTEKQSYRVFQDHLSDLFHERYPATPTLHNEILNREKLSTAGASARTRLIRAILAKSDDPWFEADKYPPELSMFHSMLREGGFTKPGESNETQGPNLVEPNTNSTWFEVWQVICDFLSSTQQNPRTVEVLYELLRVPPYGVRNGVLPVLLALVMRLKEEAISLFEEGVFLPTIDEAVLDRIVKRPDLFSLRCFTPTTKEQEYLSELAVAIQGSGEYKSTKLSAIARSLVKRIMALPPFTQTTSRITSTAKALRQCVMTAKDPYELLFVSLPSCSKIAVSKTTETLNAAVVGEIREGLEELDRRYSTLIADVGAMVRSAFFLDQEADLHGKISTYAETLASKADKQSKLGVFCHALSIASKEAHSTETWLEQVARISLDGKPLTSWVDQDIDRFELEIKRLANQMGELELLVSAQTPYAGEKTLLAIDLKRPGDAIQIPTLYASHGEKVLSKLDKEFLQLLNTKLASVGTDRQRWDALLVETLSLFLANPDRALTEKTN